MRYFLAAVLICGFFDIAISRAAIVTHDELLAHVQASDLLCDLLTWNSDRMSTRVLAMREYLQTLGKLEEFDRRTTPTTQPAPVKIFYYDLVDGAVKYVKSGGDKFADPVLATLDDSRLLRELTALEAYDVEQFSYLKLKRDQAVELNAELQSLGKLDDFEKWAQAKDLPGKLASTTQPSALSSEQIVETLFKKMQTDRDAAWKLAQAKGMSQEEFDRQWTQRAGQFKSDMAGRVAAMGALSSSLDESAPMESPTPQIAPQPNVPPPVPNTWRRIYSDPFTTTYQGPGIYNSYDRRLNDEYDQRVNGEFDRRHSLGYDRRENIRVNIRHGV